MAAEPESHFIVQRLHTGALLRVSSSDTLALGRTQLGASYAHVSREQARLSVSSASILHVEHLGRPTNPTVIRMCGGAEEVLSDRGSIYSVIAGDSIILDYKQPVETAFLVKGHGPPPRPLPSPSSVPASASTLGSTLSDSAPKPAVLAQKVASSGASGAAQAAKVSTTTRSVV